MPSHTVPRQPLSCENCRNRKIKCQDAGQVPCASCVRRGHSHSCFYKRPGTAGRPHTQQQSGHGQSGSNENENELLYRIRNLEDLLKKQIAQSQSSQSPPDHAAASTPARSDHASFSGSLATSFGQMSRQNGSIITSPAGYQHYSPKVSTLDASLANELAETVPTSSSSINFPFSSDAVGARSTLLDLLPPSRQCDELKSVFFEVFSPLFHVLHDPTFDDVYSRFQQDPSIVPLSWLALLFVILAIAVTALDEHNPLLRDLGREPSAFANIKKLSAKYRSAAMQCLTADQFLYRHNLQTVQALVLLIYAMNHANISSWALLGMTYNIAVRIGCHVDPSHLKLGIVEGEERRRCWAALLMLHTVQNTCLGNTATQILPADVELPADLDDEQLSANCFDHIPSPGSMRAPSKMSYIIYKFRLYNIAAEICQTIVDDQAADPQRIAALDQRLAAEDQEHASRFVGQNLPIYHIAHHYILQSYTHHLYLVLHRSSLHSPMSPGSFSLQSRQRCKTSAITILEAHGHLCDTPEFQPYQWYCRGLGSFHAFLAVSMLVVVLNSSEPTDPDVPGMHALIEQCIQRFENMAPRSDICAKAVAILQRVLGSRSSTSTLPSVTTSETNSLPAESMYQYPISPNSDGDRNSIKNCDWNSNPELEALLFDMAPQHWMTPNYFTWDRWDNSVIA